MYGYGEADKRPQLAFYGFLSAGLFYLVFSFRSQLPWATCENTWNTGKLKQLCFNCYGFAWTFFHKFTIYMWSVQWPSCVNLSNFNSQHLLFSFIYFLNQQTVWVFRFWILPQQIRQTRACWKTPPLLRLSSGSEFKFVFKRPIEKLVVQWQTSIESIENVFCVSSQYQYYNIFYNSPAHLWRNLGKYLN